MGVRISVSGEYNPAALSRAIAHLQQLERDGAISSNGVANGFAKAGVGMEKFGAKLQNAGAGMKNAGQSMSMYVSAPLALVGVASVKVAADFESSMSQLQAATDLPAEGMKSLSDLALKMGADTMYSAGDAADAMLALAKAGMAPATIEAGGLAASMSLAAAGGIELEAAAESVSDTMGMFGLKAKDAADIANALAGGANASSASVDSLRLALSQVGPGARNAGMSLQDTVSTLAMFSDSGLKGSDAGTSLKTMLTRLVPTTDSAAKAMKNLGLDFTDSKGRIDDVGTVADKLKEKLGPLSQEQRSAALATIFGSDATRAATILMNEGSEGLARYMKATRDKEAADRMAESRMQGVTGAMEAMKGSLETAAIVIGSVLAPYVMTAAGWIGDLTNAFLDLSAPVQGFIVAGGAIVAAIGPVLVIMGTVLGAVGGIISALGALSGVFATVTAAVAPMAAAISAAFAAGGASAGIAAVGAALSGLAAAAWPVVVVVAAVVAAVAVLAAGAYMVYSEWDKVGGTFTNAANLVGSALSGLWASIQPIISGIGEGFAALWEYVEPALQKFKDVVTEKLAGTFEEVAKTAAKIIDDIAAFFDWIAPYVGPVLTNLAAVVGPILSGLITYIGDSFGVLLDIVSVVMALMRGDWSAAWEHMKSAGEGLLSGIDAMVKGLMEGLFGVFTPPLESIKTAWSTAWEWCVDKFKIIFDPFAEAAGKYVRAVRLAIGAVMDLLHGDWGDAWQKIKDAASTALDGVVGLVRDISPIAKEAMSALVGKLVDVAGKLPEKIRDALGGLKSLLVNAGEDVVRGLWDGISSMGGWLKDLMWKWVKDVLPGPVLTALGIDSPSRVFAEMGRNVAAGLAVGVVDGGAQVTAAGQDMAGMLVSGTESGFGPSISNSTSIGGPTSSSIVVQTGAVQVNVTVGAGSTQEADSIGAIVSDAVDDSLRKLLMELGAA